MVVVVVVVIGGRGRKGVLNEWKDGGGRSKVIPAPLPYE